MDSRHNVKQHTNQRTILRTVRTVLFLKGLFSMAWGALTYSAQPTGVHVCTVLQYSMYNSIYAKEGWTDCTLITF
jgi:hypothetical protein